MEAKFLAVPIYGIANFAGPDDYRFATRFRCGNNISEFGGPVLERGVQPFQVNNTE